jgi:polyribonucleotide nucleotidyltransferase
MEAAETTNPPTFESFWAGLQEVREIQKENARIIGKLGNRFGELVEHLVAPNIMKKFNEQGFHFNETATDKKFADPETHKVIAEVDVYLENGDITMSVEVKAKPKREDIDDHIHRMEILRRYADKKNDKRRFQGAIAGAIMGEDVRRYILENGFYLIEQTGDTVQITIPEGFKARDW